MDLADRIQFGISYLIRCTILVAMGVALWNGDWLNFFLDSIILFLTFLPAMIERNYRVYLPVEFELVIVFFVYATLYLGEQNEFYTRFAWWDMFLHGLSGVMLGVIGFLVVYILNGERRVDIQLAPGFVALFSFAFALSIGTIWEIFEYGMDVIFGTNMQKSGLQDTMGDLMIDAVGGIIASVAGYLYLKKGQFFLFDRFLRKFIQKNPKFFEKIEQMGSDANLLSK